MIKLLTEGNIKSDFDFLGNKIKLRTKVNGHDAIIVSDKNISLEIVEIGNNLYHVNTTTKNPELKWKSFRDIPFSVQAVKDILKRYSII